MPKTFIVRVVKARPMLDITRFGSRTSDYAYYLLTAEAPGDVSVSFPASGAEARELMDTELRVTVEQT